MHIRQTAVDAVVPHRESGVIDAEQVHHRGMNVVAGCWIGAVERFVAPLITLARDHTALDATATEPVGEDVGIVVTTPAALRAGHPAKLRGPQDDGVIKQAALFQIKNQGADGLGHAPCQRAVVALDIFVTVFPLSHIIYIYIQFKIYMYLR